MCFQAWSSPLYVYEAAILTRILRYCTNRCIHFGSTVTANCSGCIHCVGAFLTAMAECSMHARSKLRGWGVHAECKQLTAATDAGAALRKALNVQLQQANAHSLLQETKIKVSSDVNLLRCLPGMVFAKFVCC